MATQNPEKSDRYDGAKNKFNVPAETLQQNADRLKMSPEEYKTLLNDFVTAYSQNPLFAYQHTDLSDVPVTLDFSAEHPTSSGSYSPSTGTARVSPNRNPEVMIQTLIHELTHSGQDRAGLFTSPETRQRTELSPDSKLSGDRTAKALSYGPGELAAFIVEAMHPATSGIRDWRIGEMIAKDPRAAKDLYSRAAQPTRPVTNHPEVNLPELTTQERIKQFLYYTLNK